MKWITILVVLLIIGVVGGAGYWFFGRTVAPLFSCADQTQKPVIVAYGDSLVQGYGAPEQQGFVGPLSTQIGTTIINEGVSGNTTAQALARLPDVLAHDPNIVIVLMGGNDALQQIPYATTQANLDQILSTLTHANIHVVLVGVLGGIITDPYAPLFKSLADKYHVYYVPNILQGLIGNSSYMYDEVHPNAAGYDIAAHKIYPALNAACKLFESSH